MQNKKQGYRSIIALKDGETILSCGHKQDSKEEDKLGKQILCSRCFVLKEIQGF